ncbi:hypothetical protein HDU93_007324 [Gonapodya sp. JEL0774]|nr:hypothetical protein HDU93_007324 [Gonapodya sp. JEL0774]
MSASRNNMVPAGSAAPNFQTPRQAASLAVQQRPTDSLNRRSPSVSRPSDEAPPRQSMSAPRPSTSSNRNSTVGARDQGPTHKRESSNSNVPPPYVPPGHQRPQGAPPVVMMAYGRTDPTPRAPPSQQVQSYGNQEQREGRFQKQPSSDQMKRDPSRGRQPPSPVGSRAPSRDSSRGRPMEQPLSPQGPTVDVVGPRKQRDQSTGGSRGELPPQGSNREPSRSRTHPPISGPPPPPKQSQRRVPPEPVTVQTVRETVARQERPDRSKSPPLPFNNRLSTVSVDPDPIDVDPTDAGETMIHASPIVQQAPSVGLGSVTVGAPPDQPVIPKPLLRIPSTRVTSATTSFPTLVPQRGSITSLDGTPKAPTESPNSFLSYMKDTLFVDAALKIENSEHEIVTAPVHRIVLSQRSSFFKKLFVETQPSELTPHGLPIFALPILPAHKSLHAVVYRILVWAYSMLETDPTLSGPRWDIVAGTRRLSDMFELTGLKQQADTLLLEIISSPATTLPDLASIGVEARKWELKDVSMLATNRLITLLREPSTADSTLSGLTPQKFGFLLDSVDPSSHFDFIRRYISVQYQAGRHLGQEERAALWLRVNFDAMPLSELEAAFLDENTPVDLVAGAAARRISSEDGAQLLTAFSPDLFYSALEAATNPNRADGHPMRTWSASESYRAVRTYVMNHGGLDQDIKQDLWSKVEFSDLTLEELTDAGEEGLAPSAALLSAMVLKLRPMSLSRQGSTSILSGRTSLDGRSTAETLVSANNAVIEQLRPSVMRRAIRWRASLDPNNVDGAMIVGPSGVPLDPATLTMLAERGLMENMTPEMVEQYVLEEQARAAYGDERVDSGRDATPEDEIVDVDGPPPVPPKYGITPISREDQHQQYSAQQQQRQSSSHNHWAQAASRSQADRKRSSSDSTLSNGDNVIDMYTN